MSLMSVVTVLCIIGVILWMINVRLAMDHKIKMIMNVVIVFAMVLWLSQNYALCALVEVKWLVYPNL